MELDHLRAFLAVVRHRHFTHAAEELYLTQPAVSQQVKALEASVGAKLLDRVGRRIELTEAGKVFEQQARAILAQVELAREAVQALTGLERGLVRIGASTTPGIYLLPCVIGEFRARYPGVGVTLELANTLHVEQMILDNAIDLGFVGAHLATREVARTPFLEDELVACVGALDPLAKRGRASRRELAGREFVVREKGSATRRLTEEWFRRHRLELRTGLELASPEAVKRAVAAGLGATVTSRFSIGWEARHGLLVPLRVPGLPIRRQLSLIRRKDKTPSQAMEAFLALARELLAGAGGGGGRSEAR